MTAANDEAIHAFWAWFQRVAPRLAAEAQTPQGIAELDCRVAALGDLAWEVGPGSVAANMFALSPDGVAGLLPLTQAIVARAPEIPGWELWPARPPRPNLELSITSDDGRTIQVDPRRWRYVLLRFPDGVFDIIVEQRDLVGATDDECLAAAAIFLDGALGEATRLRFIRDIETVPVLSPELALKATSANDLAAHLTSLTPAEPSQTQARI